MPWLSWMHLLATKLAHGHMYGNCWIMAWTSDWPCEVSAESAAGAQVNAISPEWPEGVELGSTPPRPHLRADSQGGRISIWRSPLLESFREPRTWVRSLFHYSFVDAIISLVLYLFPLQSVYLFAIQLGLLSMPGLWFVVIFNKQYFYSKISFSATS